MLKNDKKYLYTNEASFKRTTQLVSSFVMTDYEIGMHVQEFNEINVITRGNGVHYIEDRPVAAAVGDVFIIPPGVRHGYEGGKGFDVYHVLLSNKFMQKYSSALQLMGSFVLLFKAEPIMRARSSEILHLRLGKDSLERMSVLLNELLLSDGEAPHNDIAKTGLTLALISGLCREYESNHKQTDMLKKADQSFMSALAMIHENYSEKLTIEVLAKQARLSRSAFLKKFSQICSTTPAKYIIDVRLSAAEHMLADTAYPLSEIASRCGFCDTAHLSKCFVANKGISPAAFRISAISKRSKI